MKPAKHKFTLLKQIMETIPPYLVSKQAKVHGVYRKCRSFSAWSHETSSFIRADVLRDGRLVRMDLITDNFDFSATTICDLYKARWDIELFFKQVKQTLKLSDFLGYSENAVQWQI